MNYKRLSKRSPQPMTIMDPNKICHGQPTSWWATACRKPKTHEVPKEDGPQVKVRGQAVNNLVKQDVDGQVAGAWESMITTDQCTELANQARGKSSALIAMVPELKHGIHREDFQGQSRSVRLGN